MMQLNFELQLSQIGKKYSTKHLKNVTKPTQSNAMLFPNRVAFWLAFSCIKSDSHVHVIEAVSFVSKVVLLVFQCEKAYLATSIGARSSDTGHIFFITRRRFSGMSLCSK